MRAWQSKGCAVCRRQWESAVQPPVVAVNVDLHARLHRCAACGAFWEQNERYADVVDEEYARANYPGLDAGNSNP